MRPSRRGLLKPEDVEAVKATAGKLAVLDDRFRRWVRDCALTDPDRVRRVTFSNAVTLETTVEEMRVAIAAAYTALPYACIAAVMCALWCE